MAEPDGAGITVNPMAAAETAAKPATRRDLESALAGLQSGERTVEETVDALDRYVESKLESVGTIAPVVKSVVARLTEAPTNWHQSTVFYLTTKAEQDARLRTRAPLMAAVSFLMVFMQAASISAIIFGTVIPACDTKTECDKGRFCKAHGEGEGDGTNRCSYCGFSVPLEAECEIDGVSVRSHELCSEADVPVWNVRPTSTHPHEFLGYNTTYLSEVCHGTTPVGASVRAWAESDLVDWCDACWHMQTDTVDDLDMRLLIGANIRSMGAFDWGALLFASFVVAFSVCGELKDTILCSLAVERASEDLSPAWRISLRLMNGCRRRFFLPQVMHAVPMLVTLKGGGKSKRVRQLTCWLQPLIACTLLLQTRSTSASIPSPSSSCWRWTT